MCANDLDQTTDDTGATVMGRPWLEFLQQRNLAMSAGKLPQQKRDPAAANQFKIRLAKMHGLRREATVLLNECYVQRGYGVQDLGDAANRMTIVAYDGLEPIGTLSIGFDLGQGLLCDELYRQEINALRTADRKVCEFIKLAVNRSTASLATLAAVFHVVFIYAYRIHKFDDVVMEVNPRHVKFYEQALGFRQIGQELTNLRVNAPAVLLHCELDYIDAQLKLFAGNTALRKRERSIYPYGFSAQEEQGILQRLMDLTKEPYLAARPAPVLPTI